MSWSSHLLKQYPLPQPVFIGIMTSFLLVAADDLTSNVIVPRLTIFLDRNKPQKLRFSSDLAKLALDVTVGIVVVYYVVLPKAEVFG